MEWVNFKVKDGEREKLKNDAYAHRMNISEYLRWLIDKQRKEGEREMKIPKCVQKLIDRRCKLADQLATVCWELDEWLDKNNIECESCDTHTGVEIYCNPCSSKLRIMKAIADHPTEKGDVQE